MKKNINKVGYSVLILISTVLIMATLSCNSSIQTTIEDSTTVEDPNLITVETAFSLIQENRNNPDFMIIDVRTESEFILGHIEDAINIDYYAEDFKQIIQELDKNKTYIVYCRCGGRGGKTVDIMKEQGFKEVYNIKDGFLDWQFEKLPYVE